MIFPTSGLNTHVAAAPGGTAIISADGVYRYRLTRRIPCILRWIKPLVIIGLNPSTATATEDDNTIRKEIKYATAWQCTELIKVNLFALRSTDPKALKKHPAPIGPENDQHIVEAAMSLGAVILCAWGKHGRLHNRAAQVLKFLDGYELRCVAQNKDGSPKHPLYCRDDERPKEYIA